MHSCPLSLQRQLHKRHIIQPHLSTEDFATRQLTASLPRTTASKSTFLIDSLVGSLTPPVNLRSIQEPWQCQLVFSASMTLLQPSLCSVFHTISALRGDILNHHKITPPLKFSPYKLFYLFNPVSQWVSTCQTVILEGYCGYFFTFNSLSISAVLFP